MASPGDVTVPSSAFEANNCKWLGTNLLIVQLRNIGIVCMEGGIQQCDHYGLLCVNVLVYMGTVHEDVDSPDVHGPENSRDRRCV